ncbi:telomerase reverse transcriptase isoform X2 [Colletes latitarsis]|uniref:telomerase reverse transcriptase isoform X2 n=1 Tax=Colletes latitarsis TaxID=2605962 RepID=UPI0040357DFD
MSSNDGLKFHVTTFSSTNNERLYITRSTWHSIQKKFIRKKIHSNCLQPNIIFNRWQPPIGVYKLCPKRSSIRPLFVSVHQPSDQRNLNIIFKFLKQLHNTEYGLTNFKEEWTSIIRHKNDSNIEKLHIVSSDVVDAFGSIIQSRLYDIIQLLCEKLPNQLMLKQYGVKSKNYVYNGSVCYIEYFSGPHLQLPIALERLFERPYTNDSNCKVVLKSWLLNKIRNYIFHQRVKIRTKIYIIGKGVVQGAILSPILSDIYYNFILHKHMSIFINCGKIIRYVDDILYVTENENFAEQFLQLTKTGIQQYNCYFQESKTQCNKTTNSISYIGYRINCHTLEIVPKYQNTDISCSMSLSLKNNKTLIEALKQRLHNTATLKLSKFVLNNAINSKTTIKNILHKACLRQASRACILIKEIPVYKRKNVQDIRRIIKSSNYKIARNITKYFLTFEGKMSTWNLSAWNTDILRMLWKSYKNVIKKDKVLRKYFHFS